ncbi:MAG: DNA polymerase III subunit delta' [Dehalococcoidia bacterium]
MKAYTGLAESMWHVIGNPRAVKLLKRSLEVERLAQAYLLVGPHHVGKTTLAINLAQALNCEQEDSPCGQCSSCLRIAAGNHADVQIIGRLSENNSSLKKEISIGQIRDLQRAAALQPYEGKYRVFIIDGAEYLNEESANSLLKTLEEPPPKVVIALLTVDDGRLLPTIISRCRRIQLFPLHASLIEQALIERWEVAPEKARVTGKLCRGGIGWAISASLDEELLQERSLKLAELVGLATASLEQRFAFAARLAAQFAKSRDSVEDTLRLWLEWWRDLLLVNGGCPRFITNVDQEVTLQQQAEDYSLSEIRCFVEAILTALEQLEQNANPRLVLEVLMLSIPKRENRGRLMQHTGLLE